MVEARRSVWLGCGGDGCGVAAWAAGGWPAGGHGGLAAWAERSGRRWSAESGQGGLRFVFYGRVSTEDWQDPVMSRARQREQAAALVVGRGRVVAEFFDVAEGRAGAWARPPPPTPPGGSSPLPLRLSFSAGF